MGSYAFQWCIGAKNSTSWIYYDDPFSVFYWGGIGIEYLNESICTTLVATTHLWLMTFQLIVLECHNLAINCNIISPGSGSDTTFSKWKIEKLVQFLGLSTAPMILCDMQLLDTELSNCIKVRGWTRTFHMVITTIKPDRSVEQPISDFTGKSVSAISGR